MTTGIHGYPVDEPDPTPRALWVGTRVLSASVVVFFFAFGFAYAYLRAQDSRGLWNPGLEVSVFLSSVVLVAILLSAIACGAGVRRLRNDDMTSWLAWAMVSLLLGVGAIGLHVWQLDTLPFTPTQGGYASVFVGWTVALIAVELGAMYWLLSVLRGTQRVAGGDDPYDEGPHPHTIHLNASAHGFWFFWRVLAAVEVVAYVLLVLVR
jgi:heme/copper-type cytochrome/quinol oxidase subunit 3